MATFVKKTEIIFVAALNLGLLVAASLVASERISGALTLIAFLYTPIFVLWLQGKGSEDVGFSLQHFFEIHRHLKVLGWACLFTFVPFVFGFHVWQLMFRNQVFDFAGHPSAMWVLKTLVVQVLLVAFPEEFFFRGYFQTRLGQVPFFANRKLHLWGGVIDGGWGVLLLTNLYFAGVHLISTPNPFRLLTFFPGLLFSFLWSRTRNLAVPIVYHALSNLLLFALFEFYRSG